MSTSKLYDAYRESLRKANGFYAARPGEWNCLHLQLMRAWKMGRRSVVFDVLRRIVRSPTVHQEVKVEAASHFGRYAERLEGRRGFAPRAKEGIQHLRRTIALIRTPRLQMRMQDEEAALLRLSDERESLEVAKTVAKRLRYQLVAARQKDCRAGTSVYAKRVFVHYRSVHILRRMRYQDPSCERLLQSLERRMTSEQRQELRLYPGTGGAGDQKRGSERTRESERTRRETHH